MIFYRSLTEIKAFTFDLDDTLYDNTTCMINAEQQMMASIQRIDGLQHSHLIEFNQIKQSLLIEQPDLYHDVNIWRVCAIKQFLRSQGFHDSSFIEGITDDVMNVFLTWRNQITVPQATFDLLTNLANRFPLAVISNGNASIDKIGLQDYFQFALRAGADGFAKPFPDLFELAAKRLAIEPQHILHVGDNLQTDVMGAINGGLQACWLNIYGQDIYHCHDASVLPHLAITDLSVLNNLL